MNAKMRKTLIITALLILMLGIIVVYLYGTTNLKKAKAIVYKYLPSESSDLTIWEVEDQPFVNNTSFRWPVNFSVPIGKWGVYFDKLDEEFKLFNLENMKAEDIKKVDSLAFSTHPGMIIFKIIIAMIGISAIAIIFWPEKKT